VRLKNKRKKLSPAFPCKCGHSKRLHCDAGPSIGDVWCNGITGKKRVMLYTITYNCECECYVPDNLKYLEQCLKNKRKR
jgi:hypothetical protein